MSTPLIAITLGEIVEETLNVKLVSRVLGVLKKAEILNLMNLNRHILDTMRLFK